MYSEKGDKGDKGKDEVDITTNFCIWSLNFISKVF